MTDAEIKKALECHCHPVCCIDCPMHNREHDNCVTELWSLSLDLINRQQADKEALIAGQETLQKALAEKIAEIESVNKQADMWHRETELNAAELIKMQAEIERLTIEYAGFQAGVKQFAKDGKKVESEAFTDFMVRLKRKIDFYRECDNLDRISVLCHLEQDMHNFVKEMVGE